MTLWGATPPATNPTPKTHPGPIGYDRPARREGLDPVYVDPPPPRDLRTRAAKAFDRAIYGSQRIVHKDPLLGTLGHPGDPASIVACEHADCRAYVDTLLDVDP